VTSEASSLARAPTGARRLAAIVVGVSLALGGLGAAWAWTTWTRPPLPDDVLMLQEPQHVWTGTPEELDLLESAFRYQFGHNPASPDAFAAAERVFLGVRGPAGVEDPPAGLLGRLGDLRAVAPASAALASGKGPVEWGMGPGVLFLVDNLRRVDASTVDLSLEYRGACSAWYLYRFALRDGAWEWVSGGMTGIS